MFTQRINKIHFPDYFVDTSSRRGHVIVDRSGYRYSSATHTQKWARYCCNKRNRGCNVKIFVKDGRILKIAGNHTHDPLM